MTTNTIIKHARTQRDISESRLEPVPSTNPSSDPLASIIANASANQRKREEEKKHREREAKEARARFALD
ncbi:MAG: hypothetical protein L3J67_00925 [Hyphomicrobiaceae bacterium]|nr:hypothetical protein [Hyphomicrobiaceae bacterium]